MDPITRSLTELFDRIPRRHSAENVKTINTILPEYEDILINIESRNAYYEKNVGVFFDDLNKVRLLIRDSNSNKASKKNKDNYFGEASALLKDSVEALIAVYADGSRTA